MTYVSSNSIANRYDRIHQYGEIKFELSDFLPDEEQCRFLMFKVLEQAIRDYCSLYHHKTQSDKQTWEEARDFLFDDDYYFMWGDMETNLESFLDLMDIEIDWVRQKTKKKFNNEVKR